MQMLTEIVIKQPEFTELLAQVEAGRCPGSRLGAVRRPPGPHRGRPTPGDRVQRRPGFAPTKPRDGGCKGI